MMAKIPAPTQDRAKRLALILQAIDETKREFAETKTEFQDRIMRLQNQAMMLRTEIITGQEPLPLEES
jgi:hypothetical protein